MLFPSKEKFTNYILLCSPFDIVYFLLIADEINYDVKFTAKTWSADLAVKGSSGFTDLENKIVQYVSYLCLALRNTAC